jgi:ABC-2 type transport system permease protein
MKQFLSFIRKEFRHIFRDRRTVLILLGIPIIQIILFGFALSTDLNNDRVAVLDPSQDELTHRITNEINSSQYFKVVRNISDADQANAAFKKNEIDMALIFPPRFAAKLPNDSSTHIQLLLDGSDPNMARMGYNYASSIIASSQKQQPAQTIKGVIPNIQLLYNPQMKSSYNFVPGVMGMILMLLCAMMTSISIVREKENGTMEVLLVSPMRPIFIILAKMIPYMVLSLANLLTILLLSVYLLHVPIAGNLGLLFGVSFLFIVVTLFIGLLISNVANTQVLAMMMSGLMLMMPTVFLSGMVFPVESMPKVLQWLSCAMPARWYIQAMRKVMIEGVGLQYVFKEILVLTGMLAILLTASLKTFKNRLA